MCSDSSIECNLKLIETALKHVNVEIEFEFNESCVSISSINFSVLQMPENIRKLISNFNQVYKQCQKILLATLNNFARMQHCWGGAEFYIFAFTDHKKQFNFKRNKNDEYINMCPHTHTHTQCY